MGLFGNKKNDPPGKSIDDEKSITDTQASTNDTIVDIKLPEENKSLEPVSFFSLFRFSTTLERFLNILSLFAAVGAGAAQPLMALIFGNLVQSFVAFGSALTTQSLNPTANGAAQLQEAAKQFRHEASKDALILVFIGMFSACRLCRNIFIGSRNWHVRLHLVLHDYLGLDRRSKC